MKSLARGWHFSSPAGRLARDARRAGWTCICDFVTPIRARAELGDANQNRIGNMRLCCNLIDGILMEPGEVFSFQKVVGDVSEERGFKGGPILVEGRLALSVGGGLCQISSTLFNAALMADLEILERHNHSVDFWGKERFIDLGRDAAYVFGLKDLKFRNHHPHSILLEMAVGDSERVVRARILSREPLKRVPRIETRLIREISSELADVSGDSQGRRFVKGWEVLTTRQSERDGIPGVSYESRDIYQPFVRADDRDEP